MPDELSPRRVGRRLLELAVVVAVVVVFVVTGPGLGDLRRDLTDAQSGWVVAAVGLEIVSALSYVVIFRAVFCRRMQWRLSYQIGMAEQAANSVLSVSGTGGLALGAWALRKGGMSTEHIARRSVAFFFLTSLPNVGGVIIRGPSRIDVKLGGANVFIAPVTAGDGVNSPPLTPYQGLDHFGLTVKDIDAVAAEIKGKGVEFTKEPTTIRPGVRICFIRGPQGISIELLERDKKYV